MSSNQQIGRRSEKKLAEDMFALVQEGVCGAEIMSKLGISVARAQQVHYRLIQAKRLTADCISFCSGRRIAATDRGLSIPRNRLESLGLGAVFSVGTSLKFSVQGQGLLIEAVSQPDELAEVPEPAARQLLALECDNHAGVLVMGE